MVRTRSILLVVILLVLVSPTLAAAKDKVKARDLMLPRGFPDLTEEQLALTEVPYAKGAPAVVLLEAQEYEWEGLEFLRDRYFRRLKILTEDAIEEHGSFRYTLYGDWRVKEVDARTILPDGTVIDAKEGINREKSEDGIQVIQVSFPQVQVGAILDLDIKLTSQSWSISPWTIQEWIPILETRFTLLPPVGLRFRIAPARLPAEKSQPDFSISVAGGQKAFIWYLRDVEPLPDLAFLPPVEDVSQRLFVILQQYKGQYSFYAIAPDWKTWGKELGEDWDEWFKTSHAKVETLAKQLVGGQAGPVEKAEAVRLGLRDRIRANLVGRYRFKDSPDEELESGSSTSGGIAALATLMLRSVGVEAELAVIRRRSDGIVPLEFPVPRLMNDMVVRIPDGSGGHLFFSPAADVHVTKLPFDCSGVAAFLLDGEAEQPVPLPDFRPQDNQTRRMVRATLSAEGNLAATSTETYRGIIAEYWRGRLVDETEQERRDRIERSLQDDLPGLVLNSVEISNLEDSAEDLVFKCDWEIEGFATVAGKRLIFNPNLFERAAVADWAPETREFDIDLKWNREVIDTLMFRLPDGVTEVTAAEPLDLTLDPIGTHQASYEHRGTMLVAKRHHRLAFYRIPAKYYPDLRRWYSQIAAVDEKPVVLELE
jgi:hypothetical protein